MAADFAPARGARLAASLVVAVEAAALVIAALLYLTLGIVGESDSREASFGIAALAAGAGVGLGFLARGLWKGRRWGTSPALTWQVLQGLVGAYAVTSGAVALGVGLLVPAVIGVVALALIARSATSAAPPPGL